MKILFFTLIILSISSCRRFRIDAECTKVKEVLNCSDGACRVSLENEERASTQVTAKGDILCKFYKVYDHNESKVEYFPYVWTLFDTYEDVCANKHKSCSIISK